MSKFNNSTRDKKNGFTIIEVIVAIFVITIGVLAAYSVTQQIISYTYRSASRLTATYLAKEGIEIVRNIRDTNWLKGESWKSDLGRGEWEACYDTGALLAPYDDDEYLNIEESTGLYGYGDGTQTNFKRKIRIEDIWDSEGNDILKVSVEVKWDYKGETYGPIIAQEDLYNWYPQ